MRPRVLVVGGGIAGAGAAAALAPHADVTLAEQEVTLAYHTTGRSAALMFENYGAPPIRPLTRLSKRLMEDPASLAVDQPILSRRGALIVGTEAQRAALDATHAEGVATGALMQSVDYAGAGEICGALRSGEIVAGLWDPDAADIDVAALHQGFIRTMRAHGGTIRLSACVEAGDHGPGGWTVALDDGGTWEGDVVVDAAGAWGDVVAERCGVAPVGLTPYRRTAFMVAAPEGSEGWPLVIGADNDWYFKPDGPQLLCSLCEETPMEPGDARPEEIDVALAIERINTATTLDIRHVRSAWAGQRTFAPDRIVVIGPDPAEPSFVWLVGQGGTGIQTSPAAGLLAAATALGHPLPEALADVGVDPDALSPTRLRT